MINEVDENSSLGTETGISSEDLISSGTVKQEATIPEAKQVKTSDDNKDSVQTDDGKTDSRNANRSSKFKQLQTQLAERERESQEIKKAHKALEERYNRLAPFEQDLLKAVEERRKAEMQTRQQQLEQDPVAAMEAKYKEQLQPMQQYFQTVQQKEQADNAITYLQTTYGQELFDAAKPAMVEALERFSQEGPEVADWVAKHPDYLLKMAIADYALSSYKQNQSQKQAGMANQKKAANVLSNVSKPNSMNPRTNNVDASKMSRQEIENIIRQDLEKKYGR